MTPFSDEPDWRTTESPRRARRIAFAILAGAVVAAVMGLWLGGR